MKILRSIYHWLLSWTGSVFYGKPSRDLFVVGVTGTKGKSTTLEMMNAVLKRSGARTALISSVKQEIGGEILEKNSPNTMPGRWSLQRFLRTALKKDCQYALIEVTSQGVVQHRHKFIDWNGAVFLNLHPEHIESHGSYENYLQAKLNFFRYLKNSKNDKKYFFINKNDSEASHFAKATEKTKNKEIIYFTDDDVYRLAEEIKEERDPDWLKADFNLDNMAAARAFSKSINIDDEVIKKAFYNFKGVEGRMDFIQHEPFKVLVDYAHTPDSLGDLYRNLREADDFEDDSRLICVFGSAGGGRDKWKRPELGKVAGNYCDKIILTSEDPYSEEPRKIAEEIKAGIDETDFDESRLSIVIDRKKAIKKAISEAKEGDTVSITGVGSQKYFYGKDGKIPWSEKKIATEALDNNEIQDN